MVTNSHIQIQLKKLHPKQKLIANNPARYRVAACGRRFGKTEMGIDALVNRALSGQRCWWVSPVHSQSVDVWHELEHVLKPLGIWCEFILGERNIHFPNGGYIGVRSAHNYQNLRGTGLDFAVLDEAAFHHPDVWKSVVRPMLLERKGGAMFLSTPYGRNWFWDLYVLGKDPFEPDWESWQFASYDSPIISDHELDEIRRTTPERTFEEEYLADFKADGGAVFRGVDKVCTAKPREPYEGEFMFGVDWGRDVDFTVVSVLDRETMTEVYLDRYNQIGWAQQRGRIAALYNKWKPSQIWAEHNSIGGPNIEALQAEGLPVRSFMTTAKSKAPLIEGLALAIEKEDITLLDDPLAKLELLSYQLTRLKNGGYSYDAPPGKHDDTVIARALSYQGCNQPRVSIDWI